MFNPQTRKPIDFDELDNIYFIIKDDKLTFLAINFLSPYNSNYRDATILYHNGMYFLSEEKIIDMYSDLIDDTMWGIFEYADPELGWGKSGGYINVVKAKTEKEALKKVFPEKGYMEYGAENVTEEDIDNQIDEYTEIINALKQNIKILENARKEIAK